MNSHFITEINKLELRNKRAIEFGPSFPFDLIKLVHDFDFNYCVGIERESLNTIINRKKQDILNDIDLPEELATNLITDCNSEIEFYNAYRIYAALKLKVEPLMFDDLQKTIVMNCCQKLEKTDVKTLIPRYHVLIASKVWSHVVEEENETVLKLIKDLIMPNGIIYLKLNSEDYLPIKPYSSIKQVFNKEKCDWIKSNFTTINECLTGDEGRKEYELVLKNRDDH